MLCKLALRQVHCPGSNVGRRHKHGQALEHRFPIVEFHTHVLHVPFQLIGGEVLGLDVAELTRETANIPQAQDPLQKLKRALKNFRSFVVPAEDEI